MDRLGGEESRVVGDVVGRFHAKCTKLAFGGGDYVDFAEVATKFFAIEVPVVEPNRFDFVIEVIFVPGESRAAEIRASVGDLLRVRVELARVGSKNEAALSDVGPELGPVDNAELIGRANLGSLVRFV